MTKLTCVFLGISAMLSCTRDATPSMDLVALLNREIAEQTVTGVHFRYRLDYVREQGHSFDTRLTMTIDGIKEGSSLIGEGINRYGILANQLLHGTGVNWIGSYTSEQLFEDTTMDTIVWQQPVSWGPTSSP